MSLRTIASFAVAVFLGLVAVVLVRSYVISQSSAQSGVKAGMTPVVVVSSQVARGQPLKPELVKIVNFPSESVPAGSFRTVEQLLPAGAPPKVALREMVANEPVVAAKVSGSGASANLSGQLTPGMRAISMRSNDVAGVGGFVLPGDRVDILLTRTLKEGAKEQSLVQVLADNVRVLGVDQSADADKPIVTKSVTVEVTPEQAQAISLGQSLGEVSLALRQSTDEAPLAKRATTSAELGGARPSAAASPRTSVRRASADMAQVRVTRGVEVAGYPVPR